MRGNRGFGKRNIFKTRQFYFIPDGTATYTYELPAEKILVTRRALVRCGRTSMPRFCMAITYGLAAAVPVEEELLLRMLLSVGSV